MDESKVTGNHNTFTFQCIGESNIKELGTMGLDYEKEYKKILSRYNKLLEQNKKLNKALVNLALKIK